MHSIQQRYLICLKLTKEADKAQEKKADDLAMAWIEAYIKERNPLYLKAITPTEISLAKAESQKLMKKAYEEYNS